MVLQPFGIHHVAIQVRDLPLVARFYETVLRLPRAIERHDDEGHLRAVWLTVGPTFLVLEHVPGAPPEPALFRHEGAGLHLFALQISVVEREAWRTHLRRHGVPIEHETRYSFFFRDPEGNRLAVTHHPEAVDAPLRGA